MPPENGGSDEEISSSEDEHQEFSRNIDQDMMSVSDISSEAPSLPESVADLIEIIDGENDFSFDNVKGALIGC